MYQNDLNFQNHGLQRPQEKYRDLMLRSRQLNFELISYSQNPKLAQINDCKFPFNNVETGLTWQCYQNSGPQPQWVNDRQSFDDFLAKITKCSEFTFDLECHNHRTRYDGNKNKIV